jgi:peptidoglycan-N-acetylglucosamine deacetylase
LSAKGRYSLSVRYVAALLLATISLFGVARAGSDPLGSDQPIGPIKVAVTLDDLPEHGDKLPDLSREDIARGVTKALKSNGVTQAFGFVNGIGLEDNPTEIDVLNDWLKDGYPLGNHTYSHMNLDKVTAAEFTADIAKVDGLLASLASVSQLIKQRRVFRYQYLAEGNTLEKRNTVRDYLSRNGYRIAEVTIDYDDWAWDAAYIRCITRKDQKSIAWLKDHVVDDAERHFRASSQFAKKLFGHDIDHILLVHDSALNSVMLNGVLTDLRSKGVSIVTLDEALADPVYRINPNQASEGGRTFLEQIAQMKSVNPDPFTDQMYTVEKLQKVCQ